MVKLTFTVTAISHAGADFVSVSFVLKSDGEADQPTKNLQGVNLIFPSAVGKEFEVDDSYSLEIAPKPEGQH